MNKSHFLPKEINNICAEHLTSEIKISFNQSNVIVTITDIEKYGSLNKLYKVTAWVKRYLNNLKRKRKTKTVRFTPFVTTSEIKHSEFY